MRKEPQTLQEMFDEGYLLDGPHWDEAKANFATPAEYATSQSWALSDVRFMVTLLRMKAWK